MTMLATIHQPSVVRGRGLASPLERRALGLWPRLGRRALRRCHDDPRRVAELVARRTSLDEDAILRVLLAPMLTEEELTTWFG